MELLADDVMLAIFFIYLFVADTCLCVLPRYEGLSEVFLSCPVPKLLLLAGTDRLDRYIPLVSLYKRQLVWWYAVLSWLSLILFLPWGKGTLVQCVRWFLSLLFDFQAAHHWADAREISDDSCASYRACYSGTLSLFSRVGYILLPMQSCSLLCTVVRNWFCFPWDGLSN